MRSPSQAPHALMAQAAAARAAGDFSALVRLGDGLERAGVFPEAWACLADGSIGRKLKKFPRFEAGKLWDGTGTPDRHLLVLRMMRHLGAHLRMVRVLALLSRESGPRVTLCVEPRIVDLVARSFPAVRVRPESDIDPLLETADAWASYEQLARMLWTSPEIIHESFVPLQPDPARRESLRAAYRLRSARRPVVGLSWYSTNPNKSLPAADDWKVFFEAFDSWGVSVQYDAEAAGRSALESGIGREIALDPSVDAFADIDGLAAQIAATDLVVTISNTTAHLAGALGHPCLVLLDDAKHLSWPQAGGTTPFFPAVRLLRQAGRPWSVVMAEAAQEARRLTGSAAPPPLRHRDPPDSAPIPPSDPRLFPSREIS